MVENRTVRVGPILAFLALALTGCVSQTVPVPAPARGAASDVAPALVVERFLQAANVVAQGIAARPDAVGARGAPAAELETMGRLFGTTAGSALRIYPRSEVEERMAILASILRHDDFRIVGEGLVPGRIGQAVQILVQLTVDGTEIDVPFTVVYSEKDGWLIERFNAEALTAG